VNKSVSVAPKTPARNINDEGFVKILGNRSLQKKIIEYGEEADGSRPVNGQMVTIAFDAWLHDEDPAHQRSRLVDHSESLSFVLGDGDVISGLDMAVCLMDRGERAEIIIGARHAYGATGKLPDVPPNATLFYVVHLKSFEYVTELNLMRPVERLSLAESKKLRGNFHYNRQDFHWGIISYKK
jgi:FK506-binding protein 8